MVNEALTSEMRVSDEYLQMTLSQLARENPLDSQLISAAFYTMLCEEIVERRAEVRPAVPASNSVPDRLRWTADVKYFTSDTFHDARALMKSAAAEIERLERNRDMLEADLRRFVAHSIGPREGSPPSAPRPDVVQFIEMVKVAGWTSVRDAQWEGIRKLHGDLFGPTVETPAPLPMGGQNFLPDRKCLTCGEPASKHVGFRCPESEATASDRAYEQGWRNAAAWADRDDLVADIGSPAYLKDMRAALSESGNASITGESK